MSSSELLDSICFHVPFAKSGEPYTVTLPRVAPGGLPADCDEHVVRTYRVELQTKLNRRFVYRCRLIEGLATDPKTLILKTATADPGDGQNERLKRREREAVRYVRDLKALQGTDIPQFYGFYKGEDAVGDHWACLLLEDCGESILPKQITDAKADYRVKIGHLLARFHLHTRLSHSNIANEHVLVTPDGRVVLVNFNKVATHDCKFSDVIEGVEFSKIIEQELPDPGIERIHCKEIHENCIGLNLVIPSAYNFMGTMFPITSEMQTSDDYIASVREGLDDETREEYRMAITKWCDEKWLLIGDDLKKYSQVPWTSVSSHLENSDGDA